MLPQLQQVSTKETMPQSLDGMSRPQHGIQEPLHLAIQIKLLSSQFRPILIDDGSDTHAAIRQTRNDQVMDAR